MNYLSADPIDPIALLDAFARACRDVGAIVSFTGVVRADHDVHELWLDHHPTLTDAGIAAIEKQVRSRLAIDGMRIVHRVGSLRPGEPVVFAAAAARHRRAAFDAVDQVMDRLKTDAIFWKRETRDGAVEWVEARPQDHDDRARWEDQG